MNQEAQESKSLDSEYVGESTCPHCGGVVVVHVKKGEVAGVALFEASRGVGTQPHGVATLPTQHQRPRGATPKDQLRGGRMEPTAWPQPGVYDE